MKKRKDTLKHYGIKGMTWDDKFKKKIQNEYKDLKNKVKKLSTKEKAAVKKLLGKSKATKKEVMAAVAKLEKQGTKKVKKSAKKVLKSAKSAGQKALGAAAGSVGALQTRPGKVKQHIKNRLGVTKGEAIGRAQYRQFLKEEKGINMAVSNVNKAIRENRGVSQKKQLEIFRKEEAKRQEKNKKKLKQINTRLDAVHKRASNPTRADRRKYNDILMKETNRQWNQPIPKGNFKRLLSVKGWKEINRQSKENERISGTRVMEEYRDYINKQVNKDLKNKAKKKRKQHK